MNQPLNTTAKPENGESSPKNILANILFNVVIPSLILSKLSDPERLGPLYAMLLALSFPLVFGSIDLLKARKWNAFAILGLLSVLLTGSFSLLRLDRFWFAVKEASIPGLIGLFVMCTVKSKYNLVKLLILNPAVIDLDYIYKALDEAQLRPKFEALIYQSTWFFVLSFAVSSILNFGLAIFILQSPAGSVEFNQELGKMTALSYPVIVLPSTAISMLALWYLFRGLNKLTGIPMEKMVKNAKGPDLAP